MKINYTTYIYALLLLSVTFFAGCGNEDPKPTAELPSSITYTPDTLLAWFGKTASTTAPVIKGSMPMSFELSAKAADNSTVASSNFTMGADGAITAKETLPAGTYRISLKATNSAGSKDFANVLKVVVKNPITFDAHIKSLMTGSCAPCHVTGGTMRTYDVYANAKSGVDAIIDRTHRKPGTQGFMPLGKPALTTAQLNLIKQWKADGLLEK